jgi:hypothetical protein
MWRRTTKNNNHQKKEDSHETQPPRSDHGRQRGQGKGYGGPPASDAERAARQAACLAQNGGVCPQDGVCAPGKGQGQGNGNGQRRGLRDGTGPRSADGTCPVSNAAQQRGRRQ